MVTEIAKNISKIAKDKAKAKSEEINFILDTNLCPQCGDELKTMNSDFSLRRNIKICERCNKKWDIHVLVGSF